MSGNIDAKSQILSKTNDFDRVKANQLNLNGYMEPTGTS